MPVRSLNSSVLKWPDREQVDLAMRIWADREAEQRPELLRLGYFGSYARGNWGVGSDLDIIALVARASDPFERRSLQWDLNTLPVPAELLVYTADEWSQLQQKNGRFAKVLRREVVWVFSRPQTGHLTS
jgi:predicted nucleotidyltransferase